MRIAKDYFKTINKIFSESDFRARWGLAFATARSCGMADDEIKNFFYSKKNGGAQLEKIESALNKSEADWQADRNNKQESNQ